MRFLAIFLAAASIGFAAQEQTLSIVKPDAVEQDHVGDIQELLEKGGLKVVAGKELQLTAEQAKEFYAIHKDRPFYNDLVAFMTSGPVFVQVLEGPDAVMKNRELMVSIRETYGTDKQKNAVHGSDSLENAQKEISFFFTSEELNSAN
ncbi:MAG: nucleoside-diphosphate kinase [Verrucomicrobia bacterium]|nr:nucleoside-diphosphate kinase [Verrucomicrobiota bacterium]